MESKQLVVVIVVKLVHKPLLFCALYLLNLPCLWMYAGNGVPTLH